ncbi:hypothetical protein L914_17531 [Phytophthora nicotianae]|uniref:Uncharacterized protein n=1 Tax=Phytophthora nicotianae TaxID=4792 RepID=W2MIS8_PHYNI|nr:hypothetical protein L914_17531 [Phytophthora nicotianae]
MPDDDRGFESVEASQIEVDDANCRVPIQAEDFGGGILMPYYGHCRSSADYFNSNLMLHNFVVADVNNVYFDDERGQGKNVDAICSLRLLYHPRPNLYTPMDLVEKVNEVKSVKGVFIDHNAADCTYFVGWGELLAKYFSPPSAGYTANYPFEIDNGVCTARKTVDTPNDEAIVFPTMDPSNIPSGRKALISELFGSNIPTFWEASLSGVQLPKHPTKERSAKKMKSLAAKYFSIPKQYLKYYPNVPEVIASASTAESKETGAVTGSHSTLR